MGDYRCNHPQIQINNTTPRTEKPSCQGTSARGNSYLMVDYNIPYSANSHIPIHPLKFPAVDNNKFNNLLYNSRGRNI